MQGGRIQQIDRPEEIYEAPANRFVADFIGGANLIPARIGPTGAEAVGFGVIPAAGTVGDLVTLAVRPERLGLVAMPHGNPAIWGRCGWQSGIYMGNELSFRLEGAEVPLHVTLPRGGVRGRRISPPVMWCASGQSRAPFGCCPHETCMASDPGDCHHPDLHGAADRHHNHLFLSPRPNTAG